MSTTNIILTKYLPTSSIVTFEEFINDIPNFTPTFIPIIDISIMTTLGTYLNNMCIHYKWLECPNITGEFIKMILTFSDDFVDFDQEIIENIVMIHKKKGSSPSSSKLKNDIFDKVDNFYKIIMEISLPNSEYLSFRQNLRQNIDTVFDKYTLNFNEIDIKEEEIQEKMCKNFSMLEQNEKFQDTCILIEKIKQYVSKEVKKFVGFYKNRITENQKNMKTDKFLETYQATKKQIFEDFDKEIEETIIKSIKADNKIDDDIVDVLVKLFDCEKAMYRMDLQFDEIEYILQKY